MTDFKREEELVTGSIKTEVQTKDVSSEENAQADIVDNTDTEVTDVVAEVKDEQQLDAEERFAKEVEDGLSLWEFILKWEEDKLKEKAIEEADKAIEEEVPEIHIDDIQKEEEIEKIAEDIAEEVTKDQSEEEKIVAITKMFIEEKEDLALQIRILNKKNETLEKIIEKKDEEIASAKYWDNKITIDDDTLGYLVNNYKEFKGNREDIKKAEKYGSVLLAQIRQIRPDLEMQDIKDIIASKKQLKLDQMSALSEWGDNTLSNTQTKEKQNTLSYADYGFSVS